MSVTVTIWLQVQVKDDRQVPVQRIFDMLNENEPDLFPEIERAEHYGWTSP